MCTLAVQPPKYFMLNIPYTYLIGWSKLNKWYYGCRTSKTCHPDDLWITYFTSSKHVKKFREQNGEPDIVTVRRIFTNRSTAVQWEHKVLRRLNAAKRINFLNKTIGDGKYYNAGHPQTERAKQILRELKTGSKLSDEARKKISESKIGKKRGPMSAEQKAKISASRNVCLSSTNSEIEVIIKIGLTNFVAARLLNLCNQ
jgi:hypothetical protein